MVKFLENLDKFPETLVMVIPKRTFYHHQQKKNPNNVWPKATRAAKQYDKSGFEVLLFSYDSLRSTWLKFPFELFFSCLYLESFSSKVVNKSSRDDR